jgi:photosystem II stability/assembly factor-like uncharacterized protein
VTDAIVERSTDGGMTWTRDFQANGTLLAGAMAPDGTVWLAGRDGVVLRRTAATGWARVTTPAPGNIVSVTEVGTLNATVSYADGRRFATADGGVTWR